MSLDCDLLKATKDGKLEDVKALLDAGVNIDTRGVDDNTPLIIAVEQGN